MTAVKLTEVRFLSPVTAEGRKESGLDSLSPFFAFLALVSCARGGNGERERKEGRVRKGEERERASKKEGRRMLHIMKRYAREILGLSIISEILLNLHHGL